MSDIERNNPLGEVPTELDLGSQAYIDAEFDEMMVKAGLSTDLGPGFTVLPTNRNWETGRKSKITELLPYIAGVATGLVLAHLGDKFSRR